MEFSSQETPSVKLSGTGSRWIGIIVFVVAVAAVLVYASQQEHDIITLAVLCSVLLIGEILAAYQWYRESKRQAVNDAAPRILEAFDLRMKQSFANQEIIHKEVHTDFETLSKQLAAIENALKYLANRQEETAKNTVRGPADSTEELAEEIAKLQEKLNEISKEFAERIDEQTDTLQTRLAPVKHENSELSGVNERLEAIVATQDEILEKFESLSAVSDDADSVADEIFMDEAEASELPEDESDGAFPLPQNMFERAQAANAESVASAVSKLIADVPAKEAIAGPRKCLLVIEYHSTPAEPVSEKSPEIPAEPETISEETAPEQRPIPEGELPLIEDLPHTALILKAAFGVGERPYLRGNAPGLSTKKSVPMDYSGSNLWRFDFGPMKEDSEITIFRNDTNEALGAPFKLRAGKVTTLAFSPNA